MEFSNTHKIIITHYDQAEFITGKQVWINILKLINVIHHIKNLKKKIHMITLTEIEKASDKSQNSLVRGKWAGGNHTSQKNRNKRELPQPDKEKPTVHICLTVKD